MLDTETGKLLTECTWDTSRDMEDRPVRLIENGRIGLRHMSTRQHIYWDLKVSQL